MSIPNTAEGYLAHLKKVFTDQGDPIRAEGQMAYLRNQFEHYGLKAPEWVNIVKPFYRENGLFSGEELRKFARLCFEDDHRELHYASIEMVQLAQKLKDPKLIQLIEWQMLHRSWWDTVDWLSKLAGIHFLQFPEQKIAITNRWIESDNLWLKRAAIIFQLLYRDKTDEALLFDYILRVKDSKEFFLQKAAGWALRNYSRTNPESVLTFTGNHKLAPLTVREGLRLIKQ